VLRPSLATELIKYGFHAAFVNSHNVNHFKIYVREATSSVKYTLCLKNAQFVFDRNFDIIMSTDVYTILLLRTSLRLGLMSWVELKSTSGRQNPEA